VILRELAGVFLYLACDKVKEHVAFFFGATSFVLTILQPPDVFHFALPLPFRAIRRVSGVLLPRFTVFTTRFTGVALVVGAVVAGAVVVTGEVVVVTATSSFWPTLTTGAE
jgi:hypothetical protein